MIWPQSSVVLRSKNAVLLQHFETAFVFDILKNIIAAEGGKKGVVTLSLPKQIIVFWSFSGQSVSPANQMPSVCIWTL